MEELKEKIKGLYQKILSDIDTINLTDKAKENEELKKQILDPDFWSDQEKAREVSSRSSNLEEEINQWQDLKSKIEDLNNLIGDEQAADLSDELEANYQEIKKTYDDLAEYLLLQGKHDSLAAIVTINAGAGGVDAQDWAEMLERMYLRFAETCNWTVKYLSKSTGAEAGIKSATFEIKGHYVYGYMKNEKGVHRLVRLSPFDADHARHTSFAMVEVLPELEKTEFELKDDDLKIDTFRASGHGGQSVNTTDSAVRITHLPTGITASCQNERSQLQNKRQAMVYLQSKLQSYQEAEAEAEKQALKGKYTEAAWGNQIRSYVIHPYKMVKDHRTNFESKDPDTVLDGALMPFIISHLTHSMKNK